MSKLGDDELTSILNRVYDVNDGKSFSLVCKRWLRMEGETRLSIRVLESDLLQNFLPRFTNLVVFKSSALITDAHLQFISVSQLVVSATGKFGGIAKLHFEEPDTDNENLIKVEYHKFEKNTFCSGATFVPKPGDTEEDDGWIITHAHNEDTDISKAYIIDTKKFCSEPVAKIGLPCRVPYGFHGAFMPIPLHNL